MEKTEVIYGFEIPERYDLRIEPDMRAFTFDGEETIEMRVKKSTFLLLHAKELEIKKAFAESNGKTFDAKVSYDAKKETVKLALPRAVEGKIKVMISFKGKNNDGMYGFYRSSYTCKGVKNYLLTTQFEPADARAAFPCIDEPSAKAIFDLTLVVDKELEAISNMPVKNVEILGSKKAVRFEETPRMSTYLLYMGVGKFEYLEGKLGGMPIRVVTTAGKKALGGIALDFAKRAISYYQKYFGINYPLPKVDLIAIPDFAAGAMENWGAITFREVALLAADDSPIANKQRVAEVVMHELAHQWFGDLVTMKWWDDLWLNESFATFMSYKAMDELYPEWRIGLEYAMAVFGTALSADALKNTHPINVKVKTPAEINSIFDNISYEKGGSILHMLESYVGKDAFREGLHRYLTKHSFGNAEKQDLWLAIDQASRARGSVKGVSRLMKEWIERKGYPVVIERKSGKSIGLYQKRFLIGGYAEDKPWPIPITYITDNGKGSMLMKGKSAKVAGAEWIKLNYGLSSFHRSDYDEKTVGKLGELVKKGMIDGLDAWSLVSDLFAATRSGRMKLSNYMTFVSEYCMGIGYPANAELLSELNFLSLLSYNQRYYKDVNELRRNFANAILGRLGLSKRKGESTTDSKLRGAALLAAGISGDRKAVDSAKKMFSSGIGSIDADLKGAVYAVVARNGDKKTFDKIVKLYNNEERPDEKVRLLGALGYFGSEELVSEALAFSKSRFVKLQDSMTIPSVVASNPVGKSILWGWTKRNWESFMKKYSEGAHMLQRFVDNLSTVSEAKTRNDIASFFSAKGNSRADIERSVKQTLERIDANIGFIKANS
ncbi:MAG: M1 family metallopeptidase [Candidatus Micrarchaeia archaeon]